MKIKIILIVEKVLLGLLMGTVSIAPYFVWPPNKFSVLYLFILFFLLFCAVGFAIDSIRKILFDLVSIIRDIAIDMDNLRSYAKDTKANDRFPAKDRDLIKQLNLDVQVVKSQYKFILFFVTLFVAIIGVLLLFKK